jgi:CDP-6-deoxy-D-xylo-4-hexulose-3-dehydrase
MLRLAAEYYREAHQPSGDFKPGVDRVPYGGRVFGPEELESLVDASLDFWLTHGSWCSRFEEGLAGWLGLDHCCLVNSGSSANLLAFMTLTSPQLGGRRIRRGDEVITVAAGFPTTVSPIVQFGAVPVFVDVTLPQYNVDTERLEQALTERTKAVMVAHTLGNPFAADQVLKFCRDNDLWLIEDNCDALGSTFGGRLTGTFGHLATSSFYPPHHMTTGEGGAVYTSDPELARILLSLRDWGRDCFCPSGVDNSCGSRFDRQFGELPAGYDHKYVYSNLGYNLKATEMQAAIGVAQLARLPDLVAARRRNWQVLRDSLADMTDVFILPEPVDGSKPSWFGFLLTLREGSGLTRDDAVVRLEGAGIQTRMLFAGNLVRHPCFLDLEADVYRTAGSLEVTDRIMNDTFWVGVYPGLTDPMLSWMVEQIRGLAR